jgi:hypothetical protein
MGLGITASTPCLPGVLRLMLVFVVHHLGDSENQLAKVTLRGSSVLTQDFRGPQNEVPFRLPDCDPCKVPARPSYFAIHLSRREAYKFAR